MASWREKVLLAALPLASTLCIAPVAPADHSEWQRKQYEERMSRRDLYSFERYLDTHWETAQQLYQDPELLRNRRYIRAHDSLHAWLEAHPDATQALQENPHKYLWRQRASQPEENREVLRRMSERDLRSFDNFLDANPETARLLNDNPDLINNREFVRDHISLEEWLVNHPRASEALRANPHKFVWRERTMSPADFLSQFLK